jgi:hypothetical protein
MPALGMARPTMQRMRRLLVASLLVVPLVTPGVLPGASAEERRDAIRDDIDTEHLFGFVTGTDVGEVGDREIESETNGRFGKRTGSYAALTETASLELVPFDNFRLTPAATLDYHAVSGVADLSDVTRGAFQGVSLDMRYRVIERQRSGIGVTLLVEPHWSRLDDISGERADRYGADLAVLIDRELVPGRVVAAFNLLYQPDVTRSPATGTWSRDATLGVSGGVMARVGPGVFAGGEARWLRAYDGLGLDAFAGQSLFVGPNLYIQFSERWRLTGSWSVQVAGHAVATPGVLDLTNFTRHEGRLSVGYAF